MNIITYPVTFLDENVYFYFDEETKNAVIIDPGGEPERIIKTIKKNNLNIKAILLTHGHFDHMGASETLRKQFSVPIICHYDEKEMLENSKINLSFKHNPQIEFSPDILVNDNDDIIYETIKLKVIHTPGHSRGSVCFYNNENILFSGDTLFFQYVGRTDLPNSEPKSLESSIRKKLYILPEETIVYSGHEQKTTIGYEKKFNFEVKSL